MIHNLDEFMIENDPEGFPSELPVEPEEREKFKVETDAAAAWAMRKLRSIRGKQKVNSDIAEKESKKIEMWLTGVNHPLESNARFFESLLTDYAFGCRLNSEDGRKTLDLPSGKVSTRVASDKWSVENSTFVEWAKTNASQLIKVVEQPDLSAMKSSLVVSIEGEFVIDPTTGERVPGVEVTNQGFTATVTPDVDSYGF
jgi:hypothetical protein